MGKYLCILLSLFLVSCEQYFIPDIDNQESILVFEGLLTDQADSHVVKIFKSQSFNEDSIFQAATGFQVRIEGEFGTVISLEENAPGYYYSESDVKGNIGTKYRMVAIANNGNEYTSGWELLESSAPIDSIHGVYTEETILKYYEYSGYVEELIPGLTILNNLEAKGYSSFYRYEYDLVYQSLNTYPTIPFPTYVFIARPATSKNIDFLSIVNGNLYTGKKIIDNNVGFISKNSMYQRIALDSMEIDTLGEPIYTPKQITFQQSGFIIRLHQYSLSESGFSFWEAIDKQSNSSGQIFDPVDSQIEGNIACTQDTTALVFGYFGASAISQKIMFINLSSWNEAKVQPAIYFPELQGIVTSYSAFDFWVN